MRFEPASDSMNQDRRSATEEAIVAKAVLSAAKQLGITNRVLATTLNLPEMRMSGLVAGVHDLRRDEDAFRQALAFLSLFRALDAIVGGDQAAARDWMHNKNAALDGAPADLIQAKDGLRKVIAYLETTSQPA